jgi:DNA-binding response OmpR family regulator
MNWSTVDALMSVLIVEPDDADRVFLGSALTSAGVDVIEANNFRSAEACLETQAPSLLVTEIHLGNYSGLQLAFLGRRINPQMPLVVTSRFHDRSFARRGEALGAVFVQKPMTQGELFAALYNATLRAPLAHSLDRRSRRRRRRDIASFLLLETLRR